MFNHIKRLFESGRLTAAGVQRAVERGWITADDAAAIVGA